MFVQWTIALLGEDVVDGDFVATRLFLGVYSFAESSLSLSGRHSTYRLRFVVRLDDCGVCGGWYSRLRCVPGSSSDSSVDGSR